MRPPRLPLPVPGPHNNTALWVDEAIWGHRFHDEQTPWMTLLEMLGVLHARVGVDPFAEEPDHGGVKYQPVKRMALRSILFDAPFTEDLARRYDDDDSEAWTKWLEKMRAEGEHLGIETDYSWLRAVFEAKGGTRGSFRAFAEVLRLLRTTAVEGDSNKRWTSRFVFPYGPAALYPDLRWKNGGGFDMDRRFFARTGELVYLMLSRSGRGPALYAALAPVVLNADAPWNRLVAALQPPADALTKDTMDPVRAGYLPYPALPDYTQFAGDLLVVLRTGLPGYDALPHLVDLVGLHLVLYILRRAAEWAPGAGPVRLVMEIVAPRRSTVRDLSVRCFAENCDITTAAVDGYIQEVVAQSPAWVAACAQEEPAVRHAALRAVLSETIRDESGEMPEHASPEAVLADVRERARRRHEQHLRDAHAAYAQAIGLASRRGTRRMRYAPSDQLLKTLVLTVVKDRMEFQQFLEQLWERYHLVIGHHQAEELVKQGAGDQNDFIENGRRLEMRLASLGLLRRLSDACAYVVNPMGGPR